MDEFIHRQNLALFERRLADPSISDAQRKAILKLLSEVDPKRSQTRASTEEYHQ